MICFPVPRFLISLSLVESLSGEDLFCSSETAPENSIVGGSVRSGVAGRRQRSGGGGGGGGGDTGRGRGVSAHPTVR